MAWIYKTVGVKKATIIRATECHIRKVGDI
jgi:hypothetical protein